MKLGIISDIHVDLNELPGEPSIEEELVKQVERAELDVLILAGDISNDVNRSLSVLAWLQAESGIPVLFVPGNHDYWSKENGITDTWDIYRQYQTFAGCLCEKPYALNDRWVVIGNTGWYDYSMGEAKYTADDFEIMHAQDRTWQDKLYVNWGMSNREIHRYFYESLERDLAAHQDRNIIMVTHMLSHPFFKVPMPHPQWEYFNAFLGSSDYADLYRKYGVRYGIMGHVHYRKTCMEQGTQMICACLGYRREWRNKEAAEEIAASLRVISI